MNEIVILLWFIIGFFTGIFTLFQLLPYLIRMKNSKIQKIIDFLKKKKG